MCVTHALPLQSVCTCLHARVCMHMHTELTCETVFWWAPAPVPAIPTSPLVCYIFLKVRPRCALWPLTGLHSVGRAPGLGPPGRSEENDKALSSLHVRGPEWEKTGEDLMQHIYRDTGDRHSPEGGPRLDRRGACLSSTPNGRSKFQDTPRTP